MPFATRSPLIAHTLRALAWLLRYPDAELRAHLPDLAAALHAERALPAARLVELDALIGQLAALAPLAAEARYVELFDCGRATSLHLFEHVHGDSRERGPALLDLVATYHAGGLLMTADELPDYLPLALEFASTQAPGTARDFLREMAHILNAVFNALDARASAYASVLGALLDLAGERARAVAVPPDEPLDASWAEPPVFAGCSRQGQTRPDAAQPLTFVRTPARPEVTP